MSKSVIIGGFRHSLASPRKDYPHAELWCQSTSARAWDWSLYDWSRWFDIHTVGAQAYYPGIRTQRPDVLAWYTRQGNERPIYMVETHPEIIGSVPYPVEAMTEAFPEGRWGCQLDYMAAMALHEGFDHWVLDGIGAPYVREPDSKRAQTWMRLHGTFLYWLRLALNAGVTLEPNGPNIFTRDVLFDTEKYPTPPPHEGRYGYDMNVSVDQYLHVQSEGHPFHRD